MINAIAEGKGEGAYFERAEWLLGEMERFNVKMNIATFNVSKSINIISKFILQENRYSLKFA